MVYMKSTCEIVEERTLKIMRNNKVKEMTVYAMFIAILAILSFTPIGYISVGGVSITIIHIIVLIAAFTLGIKGGLIVGLLFGVFSLIRAWTAPNSLFDWIFRNPLVSVLPRIIFGGLAGLFAALVKRINNKAKMHFAIAGLSGVATFLHTVMVLPMMYWAGTRMADVSALIGSGASAEAAQGFVDYFVANPLGVVIWGTLAANGIIEIVAAVVITPAVCLALSKIVHPIKGVVNTPLNGESTKKEIVEETMEETKEKPED